MLRYELYDNENLVASFKYRPGIEEYARTYLGMFDQGWSDDYLWMKLQEGIDYNGYGDILKLRIDY